MTTWAAPFAAAPMRDQIVGPRRGRRGILPRRHVVPIRLRVPEARDRTDPLIGVRARRPSRRGVRRSRQIDLRVTSRDRDCRESVPGVPAADVEFRDEIGAVVQAQIAGSVSRAGRGPLIFDDVGCAEPGDRRLEIAERVEIVGREPELSAGLREIDRDRIRRSRIDAVQRQRRALVDVHRARCR